MKLERHKTRPFMANCALNSVLNAAGFFKLLYLNLNLVYVTTNFGGEIYGGDPNHLDYTRTMNSLNFGSQHEWYSLVPITEMIILV